MTRWIRRFLVIEPVHSAGSSALAYVPMVMVARGLGFLRMLLVARILGEAGKSEYGLYNPALQLINPLVALVMFGAADVAERYVSTLEREGRGPLRHWLIAQYLRLLIKAAIVTAVLAASAIWVSRFVWGMPQVALVVACAVTIGAVAFYQHMAAVLRGLRAYGAAAGMEVFGALLLLILSALVAVRHDAVWLIGAYGLSVLVQVVIYGTLLWRDLSSHATGTGPLLSEIAKPQSPHMTRFGAWALVRMLLVMLFGFLSLWGVRYLADAMRRRGGGGEEGVDQPGALSQTADFAFAFTVAQLLAYLAIALWSSSYGLAARAWSRGRVRRAKVQLFRVGRFGAVALALIAAGMLLTRGILEWLLPPYASAIEDFLPGLLAAFIWYALVSFFSTYSDLREQPERGAALWGVAVLIQIGGILGARFSGMTVDPRAFMVLLSALSLAVALVLVAPFLLCRPWKLTATGMPLVVVTLAAGTLFCPIWVVDWIAGPVLIGSIILLWMMGLIVRPMDKRAIWHWWMGRR